MDDTTIRPEELKSLLDTGAKPVLLDVRQPEEVKAASIAGALCIPMNEVPFRLDELDTGKEYVVFCHHGMRSQQVAQLLKMRGYKKVKNLTGGIDAWSMTVDPKTPRYEYDGRRIRVLPASI
jgi:rhodanese-related sulfurtransferase